MFSCTYASKATLAGLALLLLQGMAASCASTPSRVRLEGVPEYCVMPGQEDDEQDLRWTSYLVDHLRNRCSEKSIVRQSPTDEGLQVYVDLDESMDGDYQIETSIHGLTLRARDKQSMLWLQYQLIAAVGETDRRVTTDDLPPAAIEMADQKGSFPFEYCGLYTPGNAGEDLLGIMHTGNVDYDWALWGHNLHKVLKGDTTPELFALTGGKRDTGQYCFSSQRLYNKVEAFIKNNYGEGKKNGGARFAILPNDNAVVCLCDRCRKAGNTQTDATPASADFIGKLAQRFPNHTFFMSAYATTRKAPADHMPANVGVLLSAMDLPMRISDSGDAAQQRFTERIAAWHKAVDRIYVWDYMCNYDDYLTPFPCLEVMKSRLQYYRQQGVKGIFLNGSGYDYCSFDDLHTYALAALMNQPEASVETLVRRFFKAKYPKTGTELAAFYLQLERTAKERKKRLPLYGGIEEARTSYLDYAVVKKFYDTLPTLLAKSKNEEKRALNKLFTALSYTRLGIARSEGGTDLTKAKATPWLTQLGESRCFNDMEHYREAHGETAQMVETYHSLVAEGKTANRLSGRKLRLSGTDPDQAWQAKWLNDGQQALTCNYHEGWVTAGGYAWSVEIPGPLPAGATLSFSFLHAPLWKTMAPAEIKATADGREAGHTTIQQPAADTDWQRVKASLTLKEATAKTLKITFINRNINNRKAQTACDEITWK